MPRPASASSASCSTTAGSPAVATTPRASATGSSTTTCGRTGLHPLIDHVRELGMEFGLWVEPEMVNPDSDLARAHPDWILRGRMSLPPSARQQQVLDLAHPEAYAYIAGRLHALLDEYPIAYLKWDHNRDLVDAGTGPGGRRAGARAHARRLPAARRAQGRAPRARDRELRLGRRAGRSRHPRPHRPHLDERQPRPARAAREPALHRRWSCRPS